MSARTDAWRADIESGDMDRLLDAFWKAVWAVDDQDAAIDVAFHRGYNNGYRDASRDSQRAGDGRGLA